MNHWEKLITFKIGHVPALISPVDFLNLDLLINKNNGGN